MELERCTCTDPWTAHPNGFKWDATDKLAVPAHFVEPKHE